MAAEIAARPPHPFVEGWHYFRQNKGALAGLIVFVTFVVIAALAPVIAPYTPDAQDRDAVLVPPVWQAGGSLAHILGTDAVGRDLLSRIIYGGRWSLFVGLVVIVISISGGVVLGLAAAFARGAVETLIMRVLDVLLAIPSLLLALVVVAILGPGLFNAMFAVALVYMPHYARLTRGSALSELQKDYVTASRVAGASLPRMMFVTVLPNCAPPLIVQATLGFSTAILDMAALGFLGMGAQPPTPEWGTMLADAREFILRAWWVVTFPGLAILVSVLAINLMGDGLRDVLDPKLKRS
ncbi:ABC transporter permease subunit [Geminicoccus roseus]|uniref:ABC transporter permease subunit n=1 Tax=Geminicoccus roseus TaxID=404900 RepID=UPI0004210190|nr:ABC transporter permease subunit [Geminicoccus roseus]